MSRRDLLLPGKPLGGRWRLRLPLGPLQAHREFPASLHQRPSNRGVLVEEAVVLVTGEGQNWSTRKRRDDAFVVHQNAAVIVIPAKLQNHVGSHSLEIVSVKFFVYFCELVANSTQILLQNGSDLPLSTLVVINVSKGLVADRVLEQNGVGNQGLWSAHASI